MTDETYQQKDTQYQGKERVGADEEGQLYKGIIVFMIVALKHSIPYMIQDLREVSITGQWLANKMEDNVKRTVDANFIVRGIVKFRCFQ